MWATAWEGLAPFLLAPHLGLGEAWEVIHFGAGSLKARTWALADIGKWCDANASGRCLAWLDDDLGADADAWAAARTDTLLVRTDEIEGLTDQQTDLLLDWARGPSGGG